MARAKAGRGKLWYYGLDPKRFEEARRRIQDSDIENRSNLSCLYQFTALYLGHVSDLAKADKKDAARNWVRFFRNARIFAILADAGFDVASLESEFQRVSESCHPLESPALETDIQAIRASLEEILHCVSD